MRSEPRPKANRIVVTAAIAATEPVTVEAAAVLLARFPAAGLGPDADGLAEIDDLVDRLGTEPIDAEHVAGLWRGAAVAVIRRNARIRVSPPTSILPEPALIADRSLRGIAGWCHRTDESLERIGSPMPDGDAILASAYVDALGGTACRDMGGAIVDDTAVDRLRRVASGRDDWDPTLRADAERLRERVETMATQHFLRTRTEGLLGRLGYRVIDTFGTRAAGLDSLWLSHPEWADHIATVVIGSDDIGGRLLTHGCRDRTTGTTAEGDPRNAFREHLRQVDAVLRYVGIPDATALTPLTPPTSPAASVNGR